MLGDRMAKRSSFGSIVRKRLSDITNYVPQPKSPVPDQNLSQNASSAKDYIDHLLKENVALMKLIADNNKIIELSGVELQKLRMNLQKMQLQNWNLAQSNSHILAELNLGKEKLKALQHQLVCKDTLLKTKNLELEGQRRMNSQKNGSQDGDDADSKNCNATRRRPVRSQSIGPSTTVHQISEKETVENKRRCLRMQSARFKSHEQEPKENLLFEIKDVKFSTVRPLDGSISLGSSIQEQQRDEKCALGTQTRESYRTSLGRPSRKAVEKIQSYKETPINIKLRRSE